jgi:cell division protein FtsQ
MSSFDTTASRFLRPTDVARLRRNQRQIQFWRVLAILRNLAAGLVLVALGAWAWRQTQSDQRFAIRNVEVIGARHTPAAQLNEITSSYVGANLFKMNIAGVQRELGGLAWVSRIEIEKRLPDTLRIRITERVPAALLQTESGIDYVDESGLPFAGLSPVVGDPDLPLIHDATGPELRRCVEMLKALRTQDPALYSRLSEVRPIAPRGFAVFDRELAATIYVNSEDLAPRWRQLYSIAAAEGYTAKSIDYADLRFSDRIVVKPFRPPVTSMATVPQPQHSQEITN